MAKRDAWMPLNVGDYLRDTGHLTAAEHGAYLLLLMNGWVRGGALPIQDDRLRGLAKMSIREWKSSRETILAFFFLASDGCYHQKRLDAEIERAQNVSEARRDAAIARHNPDRGIDKTGNKSDANTYANEMQNEYIMGGIAGAHAVALPSPSQRKKDSGSLRLPVVPRTESEDEAFARFWAIYPRKDAKIDAKKAWGQARRLASTEEIIAGLERYPFHSDPSLQKLPGGWLRDGRWQIEANTRPKTVAIPRQRGGAADMAIDLNLDLLTPISDQFPQEKTSRDQPRIGSVAIEYSHDDGK